MWDVWTNMWYKAELHVFVVSLLIRVHYCVQFASVKTRWLNARQRCLKLGMNLAGTADFFDNRTGKYVPHLSYIQGIDLESNIFPAWIYGYVQRTIWISQAGCYQVNDKNLDRFTESYLLQPNGPRECSLKCGDTTFALLRNRCFCVHTADKKFLTNSTLVTQCSEHCKDDGIYFCGSSSTYESNHLSVYKSLYMRKSFPDQKNCLAMSLYSETVVARNCQEESNCFCRNNFGRLVYQSVQESWDRCNRQCRQYGAQVVTIGVSNKAELPLQFNVWYWNGYFRFVTQVWDQAMEIQTGEISGCLAIEKNASKLHFVSKNCDLSLNALCTTERTETSHVEKDKNVTNSSLNHELLVAVIVGGVFVLVTVALITLYICRRRRCFCFQRAGRTNTDSECICCRSRKKNLGELPPANALNRYRDGSEQHVYTYIDPSDIMPLRNIYEDVENTRENLKPIDGLIDNDGAKHTGDLPSNDSVEGNENIRLEGDVKLDRYTKLDTGVKLDSEGYLEPARCSEVPEPRPISEEDNRTYESAWR